MEGGIGAIHRKAGGKLNANFWVRGEGVVGLTDIMAVEWDRSPESRETPESWLGWAGLGGIAPDTPLGVG